MGGSLLRLEPVEASRQSSQRCARLFRTGGRATRPRWAGERSRVIDQRDDEVDQPPVLVVKPV